MPDPEYRSERRLDFDNVAHIIVHNEVYHQYIRPTMYTKLKLWMAELGHLSTQCNDATMMRNVFVDMQEALTLRMDEFTLYVTMCEDAAHRRQRWISKITTHETIVDLCSAYMLHDTFDSELWEYLTMIRM